MGNEEWRKAWTDTIAKRVKEIRAEKGMKGSDLSERTKELGFEIPRSTLANIEIGRKSTVGVHEVAILAAALDVAPVSLMFDVGSDELVEVLPDDKRAPIEAVEWFSGFYPLMQKPGLVKNASFNVNAALDGAVEYRRTMESREYEKLRSARAFELLMNGYHGLINTLMELHLALEDIEMGVKPLMSVANPDLAEAGREEYQRLIADYEKRADSYLQAIREGLPATIDQGVSVPFLNAPIRRDVLKEGSEGDV